MKFENIVPRFIVSLGIIWGKFGKKIIFYKLLSNSINDSFGCYKN